MAKIKKVVKKLKIDKICKVGKVFLREGYDVLQYKMNYNLAKDQSRRVSEYERWIQCNEEDILKTEPLSYRPYISIVVPVYNVTDDQLRGCIESVLSQTYDHWQLCLADDCSTWENVRAVLKEYEKNPKIKVEYRKKNGHISLATNSAIALADGEFIAFMDCDDLLSPNALYEMARKLNENQEYDFIYSDEDKIDKEGIKRKDPHFKPDWSPDTLMSMMYTSHLGMYRTSIVKELNGLREGFEGSQDYDFTLRFTEKTNRIGHIPKVLYHWREADGSTSATPEAKPYVFEAAKKAKQEALDRRGLKGTVTYMEHAYQMHVIYEDPSCPKVSIIIPSKDNYEVYKRCIETLHNVTNYSNYEVIHVDNGSNDENRKKYAALDQSYGQKYLYEKMDFNFSKMCNDGAKAATGEYYLFLNDDMEIMKEDWLEKMVGQATPAHVGCVGAKLLYPNSHLIQHCGVINLDPGPSHLLVGYNDDTIYYYGRNIFEYDVSAVTGACLLIAKDKFEKIGGYDEKLPVAYNDVDLCYSILEAGYYNVVRNDAILYHHESLSRGKDNLDEAKMQRLTRERNKLFEKHPQFFKQDPFYSCNLTRCDVNCALNIESPVNFNNREILSAKNQYEYDDDICAVFDCIMKTQDLFLQGYAYFKGKRFNNKRKAFVILEGKKEIIQFDTYKIYRPDLQERLHAKGKVGLVGFNCYIDRNLLKEKEYNMKIVLENKITDVLEIFKNN